MLECQFIIFTGLEPVIKAVCSFRCRLFTVPYFSVRYRCRSFSSTGPSSWSLDASETGERTKCPWVGVVGLITSGEGAEKIGRLCLAFTELVAPATATPDWSRANRVHQTAAER